MKINWYSLPQDVLYVAQNQSGEWVGFRSKPVISPLECWVSSDIKETCHLLGLGNGQPNDNWKLTLAVRPNCFL